VEADNWCAVLREELARKKLLDAKERTHDNLQDMLALSLELLGNRQPFSLYTVKQFRDVGDPDRACYQEIVRVPRSFGSVYDLREIEEPLVLRLHEFPTQPLVEILGLVGQNVSDPDTGIVWEMEPVRPFALRVRMEEALGERLDGKEADSYLDSEDNIEVGRLLIAKLDQDDPRRIAEVAYEFTLRPDFREKCISLANARRAIENIDPQVVVEVVLSREWGNWDENARWREGRRKLVARHAAALAGVSADRWGEAERAFFDDALNATGYRFQSLEYGFGSTLGEYAKQMIDQLSRFTTLTAELDACWNRLDGLGVWQESGPPALLRSERRSDSEILEAFRAFLVSIGALGKLEVLGDYVAPDIRSGRHRIEANVTAFREIESRPPVHGLMEVLEEALGAKSPKPTAAQKATEAAAVTRAWEAAGALLELAKLVRGHVGMQRETLITLLCGASEKPDFVVRRDAAGPERDRLFPLAESWDEEWYEGSAVAQVSGNGSRARPAATKRQART
jgi:hypothetical protein